MQTRNRNKCTTDALKALQTSMGAANSEVVLTLTGLLAKADKLSPLWRVPIHIPATASPKPAFLKLESTSSFHLPIPPTLPSSSSSILQEAMGNCKGARGAEGRKGLPKPGRGNVVRRDKQAVQRAGWQGCLEIHAATFQEVTLLLSRAYTITQAGGTATGSPAAPDHRWALALIGLHGELLNGARPAENIFVEGYFSASLASWAASLLARWQSWHNWEKAGMCRGAGPQLAVCLAHLGLQAIPRSRLC